MDYAVEMGLAVGCWLKTFLSKHKLTLAKIREGEEPTQDVYICIGYVFTITDMSTVSTKIGLQMKLQMRTTIFSSLLKKHSGPSEFTRTSCRGGKKCMPFVSPLRSRLTEARCFCRLEHVATVHSPVSPWSGAKLLPNKTGCIPRAPPSSLQSALVFAPFI